MSASSEAMGEEQVHASRMDIRAVKIARQVKAPATNGKRAQHIYTHGHKVNK